MANEGNSDPPVLDLRTMKELCQPSLNGRGGPIAPIAIQATNFGLKNDMIQQSIKVNGVTNDALRLYLFPHSLTHHATAWFDRLSRNSINTFEQMAKMFLGKYFPPSMVTKLRNEITNFHQCPDKSLFKAWEHYKLSIDRCPNHNMRNLHEKVSGECYDLIENMTTHHNDWDTSAQRSESSSFITFSSDTEIAALKAEMAKINKNLMRVLQVNQQVKAVTPNFETCGGTHSFFDCPATVGNTQNANDAILKNMQTNMTSLTNSNLELKNMFGQFMKMNTASSSGSGTLPVERETEATKDTVHPTNNGSTKDVQPLVFSTESLILNSKPVISPIIEPVTSPDKLCELARTPLNEHYSAVLLKKFPEKLGDPDKFLIPCDFPGMTECLAMADLGARFNLMPLSVWNKLSLPDLSPTCMTLELVDRSISHPVGVAEDVFVKVGTFHFSADFVVVDFDVDPRVPLILGRSFFKTRRAFIDVFEGELTLRVGKEAITFNFDQTSRYSANYNDMTANRINVNDMACEEDSQEVLGFSDVIASGNPTPYYDPIVSTTFPTLTPFRNSDFLLEEVDAFLALEDDPTSPEVDQSYLDSEGDILLLEAFMNDDLSLPFPNQGNYLPQVHTELKICEAKSDKSSIDEPPEVELNNLPLHLKYAFLKGGDKLPVIIVKDLSVEEKTALITVLKSHKRAIAWKLSDIKRIDSEFCTHKILMEEDFEPAVQNQRRVNPKIYDVIKNEVLKLLDDGLIYPISDSPWVSPVHCVPKKCSFTVVENEENELIPTIYYCFLNGFSGYFQMPIDLKDQEKTTFTCPYGTFAYHCMPFGLCNASGTFQRCMMAITHDMIEKTIEVFIDDFSVFRNSFQTCLSHLEKMLKRCDDTNLCLNWEKSHFMVKEGIVLGHKISKERIEVDKAKVDVISKLPHPTTVKGIRSFLGHDGFYQSHFASGAVLGQCQEKHFRPIHYASKTMTEAESNYTTTEKEMLAVVYAFEKFRSYLIMNNSIMYTDHSALKYLFAKKDFKARLLRWVLLLQEFTFKVIDTKGAKNRAADHLSRLENPHQNVLDPKEINESFPLETLSLVSTRGNSSTPWFVDFANYHAGNFVVNGMSSQ
nr:transposon Ty3-I Gag-Pol polyprotein [Tanacetum cinerariifolium]